MKETTIVDYFNAEANSLEKIENGEVRIFRYDRWERYLFLKIVSSVGEDRYLLLRGVCFFQFSANFSLFSAKVIDKRTDHLIMVESSSGFMVSCSSIEIWSASDFSSYNVSLYRRLGEARQYGIRKVISSIEELEGI